MKSFFCVIEGIDGAGKTTLIKRLSKDIPTHKVFANCSYSSAVEPTLDSPYSKEIRDTLQNKSTSDKIEELFLHDRLWNIKHNIMPHLHNKYHILIQDRYYYSTIAYQAKDLQDLDRIYNTYQKINSEIPSPNLIIYLDVDPKLAIQRISKRKTPHDIFENTKQLEQIRRNYTHLWQTYFDQIKDTPLHVIPTGTLSGNEVFEKVISIIIEKYQSL